MALIYCPECGTQLSEHALQCSKCAYPISERIAGKVEKVFTEEPFQNNPVHNTIRTNNIIVWLLAFAPLISSFLQGFVFGFITSYTQTYYEYEKFWWVGLCFNIILCWLDVYNLTASGIDTKKMGWSIFVPVYLFRRADVLKQSPSYAIIWVITFLISFGF